VASRLFFLMGGAMLVNYVLAYFGQTHNLSQDEANGQNVILLALVVIGNLIAVVPASRISDRVGRKPVIYTACVIGFVGVGLAAVAPAVPLALVGGFLFGASAGMFLAVDWALMTDIIPRAESGRFMGISNLATASSTVFALAAGGPVIDGVNALSGIGNGPRAAYALGAIFYLIAILLFLPVVEPLRGRRARQEPPDEVIAAA
jgi:MFS family permease